MRLIADVIWPYLLPTAPVEKQRPGAVRTEPILVDAEGRMYWRLKGYSDRANLLVQGYLFNYCIMFKSLGFGFIGFGLQ